MYAKALRFIAKAHKGQKRHNGNNYIIHPIRVSQEVHTDFQKVVALLHDVIEDTPYTLGDIVLEFGPEVAKVVHILSKRDGESYEEYINRVAQNADATAVKIADICDNLGDSPSERAIHKSSKALEVLVNV